MTRILLITCGLLLAGLPIAAGTNSIPQEALDGPGRTFKDELLDKLVGKWKSTGKIMNRAVEYQINADWTLKHQFLEVHMTDAANPPAYEARVFIGFDNTSERYVAHWIDVFGGRWSETLGYGARSGRSVMFVFEYPDGPFHTTFTWASQTGTWKLLMQQKDKSGNWTVFGEEELRKA
jgi:hypothetical protein